MRELVPVTTAWRDELEKKTQNAILRALGKSLPSRGGLDSQSGKRKRSHFEDLHDEKVTTRNERFGLLCIVVPVLSVISIFLGLILPSLTRRTISFLLVHYNYTEKM